MRAKKKPRRENAEAKTSRAETSRAGSDSANDAYDSADEFASEKKQPNRKRLKSEASAPRVAAATNPATPSVKHKDSVSVTAAVGGAVTAVEGQRVVSRFVQTAEAPSKTAANCGRAITDFFKPRDKPVKPRDNPAISDTDDDFVDPSPFVN